MKKIFILSILSIACFIQNLQAQCPNNSLLTESFFGKSPANPPSGWIIENCDILGNAANLLGRTDSFRVGMNDVKDSVITKQITCPDSITFWYKASGASSNWTVIVQFSQDLINWQNLDSIKTTGSGSPTTYLQKKIKLNNASIIAPFHVYIRWNMTARVTGTFYLDDVCISSGSCSAIASELRFTSSTTNCTASGIPFIASVSATDANGYIATNYNGPITIALASGTGALGGTLTQNAINGTAVFNNLTYSGISPLSIIANTTGLTSALALTSLDIRTTCPSVDTLLVVSYNLLNFPNGGVYSLGGACTIQEAGPKRWDTLKYIMAELKPDIMIVQELQTQAGADSILLKSFNVNGVTKYARAPFIPNRSTANADYNNELFYNTDKLVLQQTNTLGTSIRDCGQYILYCKDPLLNVHQDTTFIDLYSIHTKAKGLTVAQAKLDSTKRANDCKLVMDSIRYRQSSSRNAIIGGDMNLYTSTEGAFINFTTGQYKFNDPVPANPPTGPNAWESNVAYAPLHTQAARSTNRPSLECGALGGLDSRLDFLLASDDIMAGTKNMKFVPGSYKAYGNSGNLFNRSIDSSINTSGVPMSVLKKMANMSDHIPVIMKVAVQYPNATPLAITENLTLFAKVQNENVELRWEANLQQVTQKMELLCDGKVIFTQQNPMIQSNFVHKNVKNGTHLYQIRIKKESGSYVMSNIVSIIQNNSFVFSISPNPFDQSITIEASKTLQSKIAITVTTINGKILQHIPEAKFENGLYTIQTAMLEKGLYFVVIQSATQKKVYKVVK
jgi:Secretion system C-terminal sorting domain